MTAVQQQAGKGIDLAYGSSNRKQPTNIAMIPATTKRVPASTSGEINRRILRETDMLAYFSDHPDEIGAPLDELDSEWDIERTIEASASTLAPRRHRGPQMARAPRL